jgi:hypothetical protein
MSKKTGGYLNFGIGETPDRKANHLGKPQGIGSGNRVLTGKPRIKLHVASSSKSSKSTKAY